MAEETQEATIESNPTPEPVVKDNVVISTPDPEPDPTPPTNGAEPTLGDGGGDITDPPVVAPPTWPEDWRNRFAGKDENDLKSLNRWRDPANIWKSYKALRARVDSGELMRAMPETDDEEVLKVWRAENGVPESPDSYHESLPEGIEISEEDKPFVDDYFARMHKKGIGPNSAHEGVQAYYEMKVQAAEQRLADDKQHRNEAEDALRGEWGGEYRPNLNNMHTMFETHAPEGLRERLFTSRMDDGTPLGDDPDFLRFMVGMAREINPFGTLTPQDGQDVKVSLDNRISEIENSMKDTKGRDDPNGYWQNESMQQEYLQLIEKRDKLRSRAA